MKLNRFFMLGLAGLAFAACGNEDEVNNGMPLGNSAVTIKIASPVLTKAGNQHTVNVPVVPGGTSTVDITLKGSEGYDETIELTAEEWTAGKEVKFWNVQSPTEVIVTMNGGKATYTELDLVESMDLQSVENVPAYGATTTFKKLAETDSPTIGNGHQAGANEGDDKKTYQLYSAEVRLSIPMSRLEVSGIQHIVDGTHAGDGCAYNKLTIAGVYLDNVYPNGAGVAYSSGAFSVATGTPQDYCFFDGHNIGSGIEAVLQEKITEQTDFLTANAVWPADGKAYGYNFFGADGADNLPKFKIYFSESEAKNNAEPLPAPRFAMITNYYKMEGDTKTAITKFEPGHIYRVIEAKLLDKNIIGDEGGNTLSGVEVTVTEANWIVDTINADWAD